MATSGSGTTTCTEESLPFDAPLWAAVGQATELLLARRDKLPTLGSKQNSKMQKKQGESFNVKPKPKISLKAPTNLLKQSHGKLYRSKSLCMGNWY